MQLAYTEFEAEYRVALRLWSETKALYPMHSREVLQATLTLELIENKLIEFRMFRPVAA